MSIFQFLNDEIYSYIVFDIGVIQKLRDKMRWVGGHKILLFVHI